MQYFHQLFKKTYGFLKGGGINRFAVGWFNHFQIPAAEIIPNQLVGSHQSIRNAVLLKIVFNIRQHSVFSCFKPAHGKRGTFGLLFFIICFPAFYQPQRIPYLVTEIPSLLAESGIKRQVVSGRSRQQHAHPNTVGTVFVHQFHRIGRIAKGFRHFSAQLIADNTGKIHIFKRNLFTVFHACHNHPGNPKEDNVGTGNQIIGRIIVINVFIVGKADSVEHRNGPQPRREPGIHHIFILFQVGKGKFRTVKLFLRLFQCLLSRFGHHHFPVGKVINRYPLPPPELPRYVPVAHIFHPVAVSIFEFGRMKFDNILFHHLKGRFGQLFHLQKPLHRKPRLYHCIGTFRKTHTVHIILNFNEVPCLFKVFYNFLSHRKTVFPDVQLRRFVERTVIIKYINTFKVVFYSQFIVVNVVSGGYFQGTRTEFTVNILVGNYRHGTVYQRNHHLFTVKLCKTFVFGVYTNRRITENGLGTGGGYCQKILFAFHPVTQVIELRLHLFVYHLFVRYGSFGLGVPVYHTYPAINQPFVIEVDKNIHNRLIQSLIHCKPGTVPVARSPQFFQLFKDNTAVFLFPFPGMFQKLFPRQVFFINSFLFQFVYHLTFGSNGSMVGSRHPAGVFSLHARTPYQHILKRIVQHMPHMKHARYVGRRNHNGIRFTLIGLRVKIFLFQPVSIPFVFGFRRIVFCRYFHLSLCFCFGSAKITIPC